MDGKGRMWTKKSYDGISFVAAQFRSTAHQQHTQASLLLSAHGRNALNPFANSDEWFLQRWSDASLNAYTLKIWFIVMPCFTVSFTGSGFVSFVSGLIIVASVSTLATTGTLSTSSVWFLDVSLIGFELVKLVFLQFISRHNENIMEVRFVNVNCMVHFCLMFTRFCLLYKPWSLISMQITSLPFYFKIILCLVEVLKKKNDYYNDGHTSIFTPSIYYANSMLFQREYAITDCGPWLSWRFCTDNE